METQVAIVGAYGSAGVAVAQRLADDPAVRLTLVDDGDPGGGLCILRGCMPSKEVLSAAEHRFAARHDPRLGGPLPTVDLSAFEEAEFVLLQYARAVEAGTVTDQIHDALAREYSPAEIVAAGLLIDFYVGLCNYVASVDLPFEGGEFVGWTPDEETVRRRFDDAG